MTALKTVAAALILSVSSLLSPPVGQAGELRVGGIHPGFVGGVHPGFSGFSSFSSSSAFSSSSNFSSFSSSSSFSINRNAVENRNVGIRPAHHWWRPGGAVAAGVAIGFVGAGLASDWAGSPPAPGYCWYYTDITRWHGFWDPCP